jgi:hypothetical protein
MAAQFSAAVQPGIFELRHGGFCGWPHFSERHGG